MFGKTFDLFKVLGIQVRADFSWIFLAALIPWSLAKGFFPTTYPGLESGTYWSMGIIGAIGLFASLIVHEFAHCLVARRYGIRINGIRLFLFGGVAEMEEEPESVSAELYMAAAGPAASFVLAAFFHLFGSLLRSFGSPPEFSGVVSYLFLVNLLVAIFNLIPAFPLDGGRVLRAALWGWKGDVKWATRLASSSGEVFSLLLIFLGILNFMAGNFIGGLWWFLIGLFLREASKSAYLRLLTKQAFEGEPISRFMTPDPISVDPEVTLERLIEDYFFRFHHGLFPVVRAGRPVGYVTIRQVKAVPREEWHRVQVGDVMAPLGIEDTVSPQHDTVKALNRLQQSTLGRMLIVESGHLVGIVSLKDLLAFFALKIDLESSP